MHVRFSFDLYLFRMFRMPNFMAQRSVLALQVKGKERGKDWKIFVSNCYHSKYVTVLTDTYLAFICYTKITSV